MSEVTVVSYGAGNIASDRFALERLGATVNLTADPDSIAGAERLLLPGVGAAGFAMERLSDLGLVEPIRAFGRPLLGICLGQQLLFDASEEGAGVPMLGLIPGIVRRLEAGPEMPVPHMGWSRLEVDRADPLLEGVGADAWAYFVHSYVCPDGETTLAHAQYGEPVPAVVRNANRWGCQFHPERSAAAGARILRNFLEIEA